MLPIVLAAALGAGIIAGFLGWSLGRARARALAEDVARSIEPYLRRKAAEAEVAAPEHPPWNTRHDPEQMVGYATGLADRLLEAERAGPPPPVDVRGMALADTQQLGPGNPQDLIVTADLKNKKGS